MIFLRCCCIKQHLLSTTILLSIAKAQGLLLSGISYPTSTNFPVVSVEPFSKATLVYRQLEVPSNSSSSNNGTSNSELTQAEHLVKAAQAEARARNVELVNNIRYNSYKAGAQNRAGLSEDPLATGVNSTVAEAAALVAEALAINSTKNTRTTLESRQSATWWMEQMTQNGKAPYVANSSYSVWRNVKSYGAYGDGTHDDTAAINKAISDGGRCGQACGSSTTLQAVVYFPPGTYLVSSPIIQYYHTQFIGNPINRPIIKASASFVGLGVMSSDVYIDGGNGASWYINQSNFLRQIRNFIIDITAAPKNAEIAALHWQVAQATSLQNIKFVMSTVAGNNQQGIFMENGSGGFLSDLEFEGGAMGAYVGNQQFTVRNLKFRNHNTQAIHIHWDWGWTWKGLDIANCPVGVLITSPEENKVGSSIFIDSKIANCPVGIRITSPNPAIKTSTLSLFNIDTNSVPKIVEAVSGANLLAGGGSTFIKAWGLGKRVDSTTGSEGIWQNGQHFAQSPNIPGMLLKDTGNANLGFYERSKPQYESIPASGFVNVKSQFGAVGNGVADDTAALNNAFSSSAGSKIVWIPAGVYIVTDTIFIPPGTKVVGQSWSQIMGAGAKFQNAASPYPVVKVGNIGDVGTVEIQDLIFTVRGKTAGAIILQWNIHESSKGSAAMWDTHVRVGGQKGSDLQVGNCPKLTGSVNPNCVSAALMVHITSKASAYFENTWFWVADHDLDIPAQTQIDIYVARGFLIESRGPVWLYGTASEHCVLYQYQTVSAANVFMGMIQTESPYYQVAPAAPAPFSSSLQKFPKDPTFSNCASSSKTCAVSWAVRIIDSAAIYIYGAGLYSWFSEYSQACLDTENCQDRVFELKNSGDIWIYSLITKASVEMISGAGEAVLASNNHYGFCSILLAWLGSVSGGVENLEYRSPQSATVIPISGTTLLPAQTFTLVNSLLSAVSGLPFSGNQNTPQGPGPDQCESCDLARLITSTCCGLGGSVANPITIPAGVPLPRNLILPPGYIPNLALIVDGAYYPPGQPLPKEVVIVKGTVFLFPLIVPSGSKFSNLYTPAKGDSDDEDEDDDTLFLTSTFWNGPHTVRCQDFPCTVVYPPIKSSTTWTPSRVTTTISGTRTTVTPPVRTTENIRVSKTTVLQAQTGHPEPALAPLCFKFLFIAICPPNWIQFPPVIPDVTFVVGPPGPTTFGNLPTSEQEQGETEEEQRDEDGDWEMPRLCPIGDDDGEDDLADIDFGDDSSQPNGPSTSVGAGTGTPTTTTLTRPPPTPRTTTPTTFSVIDWTDTPRTTATQTRVEPAPTPNLRARSTRCSDNTASLNRRLVEDMITAVCDLMQGQQMRPGTSALRFGWRPGGTGNLVAGHVSIVRQGSCEWTLTRDYCLSMFRMSQLTCTDPPRVAYRRGSTTSDNCAIFSIEVGPPEPTTWWCSLVPRPINDWLCRVTPLVGS